jgi:hypothetical protein
LGRFVPGGDAKDDLGDDMMVKMAMMILRRRVAPATTLMIRDVTNKDKDEEQVAAQDDGPQEE